MDPEEEAAAANMSINSCKSFDPELLRFEPSSASLTLSQQSFDAERLTYAAEGDESDDAEGAASQDSDASFDPEAAKAHGSASVSVSSQQSFDPEALPPSSSSHAGVRQAQVAGEGCASAPSEASLDGEVAAGEDEAASSRSSQRSFDPEAQTPDERAGRHCSTGAGSEMSFGSAVSYDPQESLADGVGGRGGRVAGDHGRYAHGPAPPPGRPRGADWGAAGGADASFASNASFDASYYGDGARLADLATA